MSRLNFNLNLKHSDINDEKHMSHDTRFPTMWYVRPDQSLCLSLEYSMTAKLLTEQHLEFLSLKGGCPGSSESTLVKMPHCWKSHVAAHLTLITNILTLMVNNI